ncbi:MAG: AtpZ/AtpI family protein [Limnochordia bacterium]|jgi:F0F1-type ATP synthase assembly protein I
MKESAHKYVRYSNIGITWVLSTAVYMYLGYVGGVRLDERLGTAPVFFVCGILLGAVFSFLSLIFTVQRLSKEAERE